jgi:hypothetical protein
MTKKDELSEHVDLRDLNRSPSKGSEFWKATMDRPCS